MPKSMTGFAKAKAQHNNFLINLEMRAVNHRYFEFSAKIPGTFKFLEDKIKARLSQDITRGKIDLYLYVETLESSTTGVKINTPLAHEYLNAIKLLQTELSLQGDISPFAIAKMPDVLSLNKADVDEDLLWQATKIALDEALANFNKMREDEGKALAADVNSRLDFISTTIATIENDVKDAITTNYEKLKSKLEELLSAVNIDENRLITEAAILAEKQDTSEEITRLRSHISQFKNLLNESGAIGRKMDFLLQEFNREINTIGSKCHNTETTKQVIEIKAEIEKIREQAQNIE